MQSSHAQRCSGANALARYHAQIGKKFPRVGLRGGIQNDGHGENDDDYYLFVPEQDLQNPSKSESQLTFQHMRRLQCQCSSGVHGAGMGYVLIGDVESDGSTTCGSCFVEYQSLPDPPPDDYVDPSLEQVLPEFNIMIPTPPPTIDGGGRLLLEEEHKDNIAAYDRTLKGFHVMKRDGAIMKKYLNVQG